MTTLDQELTRHYVSAGTEQADLNARRVARAVYVRDTIRTLYAADKNFGIDPADPSASPSSSTPPKSTLSTSATTSVSDGHGPADQQQRSDHMRKHHSALGGVTLTLVMTLAMAGCGDDDPKADPSPTTSTTATSSPTESTNPTPTTDPETPEQAAIRLATAQTKAYIHTYVRLYANPELPLSILDKYADTQALAEIKDSIQKRRDRGDRWVGKPIITKTWLGPQKVVFNNEAPWP